MKEEWNSLSREEKINWVKEYYDDEITELQKSAQDVIFIKARVSNIWQSYLSECFDEMLNADQVCIAERILNHYGDLTWIEP